MSHILNNGGSHDGQDCSYTMCYSDNFFVKDKCLGWCATKQNCIKHSVSGKRHDLEWFLSHVGERVFRNKVKCDCESCKRGGEEGVLITDKTHANYLFDVQNELGIRYHAACDNAKGEEPQD